MKKITLLLILSVLITCFSGCAGQAHAQIAATTAPVWEFTAALCEGTPLTVARLVTESVSCLHDYTLTVRQMKLLEQAQTLVISGAGMEAFMEDILEGRDIIDASEHVPLLESESHHHHEDGEEESDHHHEHDPHIWLSPENGRIMAQNICDGLIQRYPEYAQIFQENLSALEVRFDELEHYADAQLANLSCDEIITFHDGFAYMAESFHLHIVKAIEEESGSEASARELIELIELVRKHRLPAVFTEINGSPAAASVICAETGISSFPLDMAMGDSGYFESMYHNIDTLKEALQ